MTEHMRTELVADALQMAVRRRQPEPGLIHHSDQGAQYVALGFGQQARDAEIAVSMGSRGDAYDNAVAESFFATIKKKLVHRQSRPSRRDLSSTVFEYIEAFHNRQRRHSTLRYLSPKELERENQDHEQRPATKARDYPRKRVHSKALIRRKSACKPTRMSCSRPRLHGADSAVARRPQKHRNLIERRSPTKATWLRRRRIHL